MAKKKNTATKVAGLRNAKTGTASELALQGEIPSHLTNLWQENLRERYEFGKLAGRGKTGVAYQIGLRGSNIYLCLKTAKPGISEAELEGFRDTLKTEVAI